MDFSAAVNPIIKNSFFCIVFFETVILLAGQNLGPSEQSEAYFNGSAYIRLQNTISLKRQTGISFRTCSGGILFSQQQNDDSIELSVTAEGVSFSVKSAGHPYEETIPGHFLNNKWHSVYLQYRLGNLTLDVDGYSKIIANSSYNPELLSSPNLYNDGAAVLLVGKQYNGCILEGPSIVFDPSVITSNHNVVFEHCPIPEDSCSVTKNIKDQDFCITEPCMRHGTCLNGQTSYTCVCLPRYTGKNCEIDLGDPCEKTPPVCQNAAECTADPTGNFSCKCSPGYSGRHCEFDEITTHPLCKNNPCLNSGTCEVIKDTGNVACLCTPGFSGVNCELNLNECKSNPCKNGGLCIDGINDFTCDCSRTGYKGRLCEENINECLTNPCMNHGSCFDTYGSFQCQCLPGYGGSHCQYKTNECMSQPCKNHGTCIDRYGDYECHCLSGFTGANCEIQARQGFCDATNCPPYADCDGLGNTANCVCKPEYPGIYPNCNTTLDIACMTNPCKNGGRCSPWKGTFNCSCLPGFSGPACDWGDPCKPGMCRNGGTCLHDMYTYHCVCPEEWTGLNCETHLTCHDNPCENGLTCQDYQGGYYCTCQPGWTGINCNVELNVCSSEPCLNGATCIDQVDYFTCHCAQGYTGKYCESNVDECASLPCLNGGSCLDQINGFICNCTELWMGPLCERPYDACEFTPCRNNATCTSTNNKRDFICTCTVGFEGDLCERNIDNCVGVVCAPEKVCVDLINGYECRCPPGYSGSDCSIDTDPCSKGICTFGSTCQVDPVTQSVKCICPPGFQGEFCDEDIDECQIPGVCNQGICVNKKRGTFQCYCMPGYTGERCNLDFDECLSMPCQNNATCINKINNYECRCPPGYEGKDCSVNIDECQSMPCTFGSTCIDGINNFTCKCQPGLTGQLCEIDIDDCASSPCLYGSKCIDGLNSYTCDCTDTGYTGDHCEININDCNSNPCLNQAICEDDVKDYHCKCFPGYEGKNCEIDIDECLSSPCKFGGTCLERSNITLYNLNAIPSGNMALPEAFDRPFDYNDAAGYECLCRPGLTGSNCEININECESSPCIQGTCKDDIGKFICKCENGFEGERCDIDIDECKKYQPCKYGKCMDRRADYYCDCDQNYGGKNCSVELVGCIDNPCRNGGECRPYLVRETEHRFNCTCPNGFHGQTCEEVTTMSLSGSSSISVNTTREEGYDIQFRFKTTLGNGLLALGTGHTYYILELSNGRLNLHSSLLNKWEGVFIGTNLNDSEWHKVFVAINSSHLVLSANEEQTIYPITFNESYNVSSTSFPVTYIGGIPSNLRRLTHGQPFLIGCTEDVIINGEWVLPGAQNSSWLNFKSVEVGCVRKPQCVPNPCHSGGHCTDLWRDFSCSCERPYLGHTCQYNYTAATFGYENISNSLVTVAVNDQARRAVRTILDISMFIRTRQSKGQIFYLGSGMTSSGSSSLLEETYIAAQLEGGELLVRIQFNGTPEAYTVGGVKLDNGYNHLIEVIRNVTLVQVKINGTEYFRKTISAPGNLDAQILFLGGQPQTRLVRQTNDNMVVITKLDVTPPTASAAVVAPLSNVNFKGIIQDVQISNGSTVMIVEFFPLEAKDVQVPMSFGNVTFDKSLVLEGVRSDNSCIINPCLHNGTCHNTWNDYSCECPHGFKGKDCDEQEFCELEHCPESSQCRNLEDGYECIANATFDGNQEPLKYLFKMQADSTSKDLEFDTIEVTYRTRSWGSVFFANRKQDYFVIFVYHNEVVVEWRINNVMTTKRFKKDQFEGQWLMLYFTLKDNTFRGGFKDQLMDDVPNFEVTDFDVANLLKIFIGGVIYVAGSDENTFDFRRVIDESDLNMTYISLPETTTSVALTSNSLEMTDVFTESSLLYKVDQNKSSDRFKGCLGEIRIGDILLPFFTAKDLYPQSQYNEQLFELQPTTQPEIGCVLCYNADCYNGGDCHSPKEVYKCDCPAGYTADDCSVDINECENDQCSNNSTCIDLVANYTCRCLPGYEGRHCEIDIDECASNPCRHGGTCLDQIGTFKCECPEEFVGKQCEAPLLITCDNKPCGWGAKCTTGPNELTGNNFTCICTEGMEGPLCDTPFCIQRPCKNNGICNTTQDVPFCQCPKGFEGNSCETNIDDCVSPTGGTPCQNGGICIDGVNRYDCDCKGTGYNGLLCEMDIDECEMDPNACGGEGECINSPGTFTCNCTDRRKCGHYCASLDPCETGNPCVHGICQSKCKKEPDYKCVCEENYVGKNCSGLMVAAAETDVGVNILYIIIPIVFVIFTAMFIGLAVLINIARSKRATRGTYSPSAQEFCNPRVELDLVLKPPPEERLI